MTKVNQDHNEKGSFMPGSDGRQITCHIARMNENRDVMSFLVSRLNQALVNVDKSTWYVLAVFFCKGEEGLSAKKYISSFSKREKRKNPCKKCEVDWSTFPYCGFIVV